jgi:hypothetical protein
MQGRCVLGRLVRGPQSVVLLALFASLVVGCGGGGSDTPPPSSLAYKAPPAFVINQPIATLTPTVDGQVSSYAISPTLPVGLSFSTTTGIISGTPKALSPMTAYTVTATNMGGSTTTQLNLQVNDAAPVVAYASSYYAFTANIASNQVSATVSGGKVVTWSIAPALPAGLVFGTTDGSISGVPTTAASPTSYVVTATNSGGEVTANLTIAVSSAPLLDLGQVDEIVLIRTNASGLLTLDRFGHWLLQNFSSGATLARGDGAALNSYRYFDTPVDLAGSTMIDGASTNVEIRSATDGQVLGTLMGPFSWYQLASDGSYVTTGTTTALTMWSTSGQKLASRSGDYSKALTFSAPGQVLVALGAAGTSVIETVSASTGASSVSQPFQGQFETWFLDGGRFITNLGGTLWIYSNGAVQQEIVQLSTTFGVIGQGNWFWQQDSDSGNLSIYPVGGTATPTFSATLGDCFGSGNTIACFSPQVTIVDLSGATPNRTDYSGLPIDIQSLSAIAATSAAAWVVGNEFGVVLDGASLATTPRYLTLGRAWSIAAGTGYFSVATESGQIFNFDASTDAQVGSISFPSSQLSASSSGTVLAAGANNTGSGADRTVNLYSLPGGTLLHSFPSSINTPPYIVSMELSGSGTELLETLSGATGSQCTVEVVPTSGGSPIWCSAAGNAQLSRKEKAIPLSVDAGGNTQLSPDGTLIAASSGQLGATTNIYKNGTFVTTVSGWSPGWLDNSRLLVSTYAAQAGGAGISYESSMIDSSAGNTLSSLTFPAEPAAITVPSANSIYAVNANEIFSLTSAATIWASANDSTGVGATTGTQVIFASGTYVLAQQY